jgi:predicted DNA-binding antitoxin AbrB/MazE fold protein
MEGAKMPQTIAATYERGVFVPQDPVNLPEHTVVKLLIPKTKKRNQLTNAEMSFLALRGICGNLAGTDSVEIQKQIRSEWREL